MDTGGEKAKALENLNRWRKFQESVFGATGAPAAPSEDEGEGKRVYRRFADFAELSPVDVERKYKIFEHELARYMCMVVGGQIWVVSMDNEWQIIDVLLGSEEVLAASHSNKQRAGQGRDEEAAPVERGALYHEAETIECFDVAEASKDIVTYSTVVVGEAGEQRKSLVVYGLKDQGYLNGVDVAVTQQLADQTKGGNFERPASQHLRWCEYWRCGEDELSLHGFINTISISPLGDALFLGGDQCLSLWPRDEVIATHSFTLHLYYAQELPKKMYAHQLKQEKVGQIIQSEFSRDGRAVITLEVERESSARAIKIWYNNNAVGNASEVDKKEDYLSREDRRDRLVTQRYLLDLVSLDGLDCFELPGRRGTIQYFKQQPLPLSNSDVVQPIMFLTITENSAHLWSEDMNLPPDYAHQLQMHAHGQALGMQAQGALNFNDKQSNQDGDQAADTLFQAGSKYSALTFSCVHSFAQPPRAQAEQRNAGIRASFLSASQLLRCQTYSSMDHFDRSPILNPRRLDRVIKWKVRHALKIFDGMSDEAAIGQKSLIDYVVMVSGKRWWLWEVKGIRSSGDVASQGPQVRELIQSEMKIDGPRLGSESSLQYFHPSHLFLGTQDACETPTDILKEGPRLSDGFSLYCLSPTLAVLKLSSSIANKDRGFRVASCRQSLSPMLSAQVVFRQITRNSRSTEEPLLGILKEQKQRTYLEIFSATDLSCLTTERNARELAEGLRQVGYYTQADPIKEFKWVPELAQLVILSNVRGGELQLRLVSSSGLCESLKAFACATESVELGKVCEENKSKMPLEGFVLMKGDDGEMAFLTLSPADSDDFVDFEVTSSEFQRSADSNTVEQTICFVLFFQNRIQFHQMAVVYRQSERGGLTATVHSNRLWTKELSEAAVAGADRVYKKIGKLLASRPISATGRSDELPYNQHCVAFKSLFLVMNERGKWEVCLLEVDLDPTRPVDSKMSLSWSQEMPWQVSSAPVNSSDPRHAPASRSGADQKPLEFTIEAQITDTVVSLVVQNKKRRVYQLHLLAHTATGQLQSHYKGQIDLLTILDFGSLDGAELLKQGLCLTHCALDNGLIAVAGLDRIYLLGEDQLTHEWRLVHTLKNAVRGMDVSLVKSLKLESVGQQRQTGTGGAAFVVLVNNRALYPITQGLQQIGQPCPTLPELVEPPPHLSHLAASLARSHRLHSTASLCNFFIQGKAEFVLKLLVKMHATINKEKELVKFKLANLMKLQDTGVAAQESSLLELFQASLKEVLADIGEYVAAQVVQQEEKDLGGQRDGDQKSKAKANAFGDFFGGDDDDDFDLMGDGLIDFDNIKPGKPKQSKKKDGAAAKKPDEKNQQPGLDQQFAEIKDELLKSIALFATEGDHQSEELLRFILLFAKVYNKDFFSDEMASTLLRQVYLETESVDEGKIEELKEESRAGLDSYLGTGQRAPEKVQETKVVKVLDAGEIYAQVYGEDTNEFQINAYEKGDRVHIAKLGQWDSRKCALALFSVNQDVILEELQDRFDIQSRASWSVIRDLCLPLWLKDGYKLRLVVEWVAKAAYKIAADEAMRKLGDGSAAQSKAEATSLWYILMNKKPVLINLYEKEKAQGGDKVAKLLGQDFSAERWKTTAKKNAMKLRTQHRYILCATFLILGGDFEGALQIVVDDMRDPILGVLTCRMLLLQRPSDSSLEELLHNLYQEHFVERGQQFGDVYLESMGLWGQKKYVQAVNALEIRCSTEDKKKCLGADEVFASAAGVIEVLKDQTEKLRDRGATKPRRDEYLPVLSEQVGFELLTLVTKLKKAPLVTQALKKENNATGYGADGGDILADFFGGASGPQGNGAAERKDDEERREEVKLVVKDARILNQVLEAALHSGDMYQALFTLRENRELVDARDEVQGSLLRRVASKMLGDQILEIGHNPTFLSSTGSFEKQIEVLLDFMLGIEEGGPDKLVAEPKAKGEEKDKVSAVSLEVAPSGELTRDQQLMALKSRLRRALCAEVLHILEELHSVSRVDPAAASLLPSSNEQSLLTSDMLLLRYELELRLDARQRTRQALQAASSGSSPSQIGIPSSFCDTRTIIARIERQTFVFLDFIHAHTANPFLESPNRLQHSANLHRYRRIILELEQHVDCMIIWDHWEDAQDGGAEQKSTESTAWTEDLLEMWFYGVNGGDIQEAKPAEGSAKDSKSKAPAAKFDMFDDLMGGGDDSDDLDLMDMDFSAPPQAPRPAAQKALPAAKGGGSSSPSPPEWLTPSRLPEQSHRARLCSKLRTSLVMHLTLLVLAYLTNKFYICKDILSKEDLGRLLRVYQAIKQVCGQVSELDEKLAQKRGELTAVLKGSDPERGPAAAPGPAGEASSAKVKQEIKQLERTRVELVQELENKMKQESRGPHFQGLKTHILKFKCAIEKKLSQIQEMRPQGDAQPKDGEGDDLSWLVAQKPASSGNFEENLYQDKWETWLLNAEAQAAGEGKELGDVTQNPEELPLGVLSKRRQIVPESYQFMRMWLRFIIINSTKHTLQEWLVGPADAPRTGLAAIIDCDLEVRLQETQQVEGQWKGCNDCLSRHMLNQEVQYGQQILLRRQFSSLELLQRFALMSRQLEEQCTILFKQRLDVIQRLFVAQQVRLVTSPLATPPYLLRPFFNNIQKANDFWAAFQVAKKYSKALCDQYLTLLGTVNTARTNEVEMMDKLILPATQPSAAPDRGPEKLHISPTATQVLSRDLLGAGIELFKQRSEQINDFAFDNSTHTDNIALGLMTSGIREFPVVNTLRFRNRIENGQMLIDEENLKWEECLHRYDQIEEILNERQGAAAASERSQHSRQIELYQKDEPIIMAIDSLYADKSIFTRCRPIKQGELSLNHCELKPPEIWNGTASQNYLAQSSKLGITHEDPSYAVASHPHLPLYVTGNRKGILCTWKFGQTEDKSLSQFMPEIDPRQADIRRACIKKIMFNQYGDKIMSNNMEGSFTIYQVECHSKNMRKVPIFSLYDNVDSKVSDFDLVNLDNIVCTISQKQKTVKIYDTLLPYCFGRQAQVMDSKLKSGGNIVLCNQRRQVLYVFNARTGAVTELDMRKNLTQTNQYQLSQSHEVTAACLSPSRDSLITGYKDGHVKIHRIDTNFAQSDSLANPKELPLREKIIAFPFDFRGKKGQVTSVKVNQKSGGLFASSQAGVLKLLRTSV